MIHNVSIQIGYGEWSIFPFEQVRDEWVWMRIHELRSCNLDYRFKFCFEIEGQAYVFATPRTGAKMPLKKTVPADATLKAISRLWDNMGLNSPNYTAGAVVHFMRRFRNLLTDLDGCEALLNST